MDMIPLRIVNASVSTAIPILAIVGVVGVVGLVLCLGFFLSIPLGTFSVFVAFAPIAG